MKARTLLAAIGLAVLGLFVLTSAQHGVARAQTAATPTATPVAAVRGTITYTIERGDTWVTISKKFGVSASRLIDLNGLRTRPDLIFVGEIIRIPITLGTTPSLVSPFIYTVQVGETMQDILNKLYIDKTALLQANRFKSNAVVTAGQKLLIPAGPHRYVVQRGDTIHTIAAMFSTTANNLLQFNPHLGDGGRIFPGNNVFVPIAYDAPFVAANIPGVPATTTTTTTGATTGEGIGGGGEGTTDGSTSDNPNANVITTVKTITMPGNVVKLNKPLIIRWLAHVRTRLDPAVANQGIMTLVVEFEGGNGTYTLEQLVSGIRKSIPITGIYVKQDGSEKWNDIEFEVTGTCGSITAGDIVFASGDTTYTSRWEFPVDCPKK
jgi:LysM repeat protein